jgi:superfamily II helicase
VFIDEAHLFDVSVRGDQLVWLLARLRWLREYAIGRGWVNNKEIQVCAASATIAARDSRRIAPVRLEVSKRKLLDTFRSYFGT